MILREAIEKANYDWKRDGSTLSNAMMKVFQQTGVEIYDDATKLTFRELNLLAALNHVFGKK